MPGILDKITVDLEPTKTYARREADWIPSDTPGEGFLTVRLWKGRRPGSKCESDTYQVMEEPCAYPGCRSFLLLNLTDDTQPDVYSCRVGGMPGCTCKAGLCRTPSCKHIDACSELIREGVL